MTEHIRPARQGRPQDEDQPQQQQQQPANQRNEQLDEDVACCLAEIDELLAKEESERDRAIREFRALKNADDWSKAKRIWQAQYAHLGLRIYSGCCTVALYDSADQLVEQL